MTKYFATNKGDYIGGFDGAEPPAGSVEVTVAPDHASQKWLGSEWSAMPAILPDLQPYQFWAMVEISGKRTALDSFANGLPGNQRIIAQAKLQHTLSFRRDNPLVEAARLGIGLSSEELDSLWGQAASIT